MLIEQELEQAARIRSRMQEQLDLAMGDPDLTRQARDRIRAQAVLDARSAMAALRAASDQRQADAYSHHYRQAFGLDAVKSAEDREVRNRLAANPPTVVDARRMMTQALDIGDTITARALAALAWANRADALEGSAWVNGVLQPYGNSSPHADTAISNMLIFDQPGKLERVRDKLVTEIVQPSDLMGNLEYLAVQGVEEQPATRPSGVNWANPGPVRSSQASA